MRAWLVSHTHWDREWYRTFEAFRARLVDAVDRLLDLCAADPGYRFLLDGQSIALEDYAAVRPERVAELRARCAEGRIAIGPWYVQPDSLLPSGEAHVRNLLAGRRAARAFGEASRIGYTPDSFGHPAQLPQLLCGFGLRAFVYWRGNGSEWDGLPAEWRWVAPDGSAVLAHHLGRGYFAAATDGRTPPDAAAQHLAPAVKELAGRTRSGCVLLMNGLDHLAPEPHTRELAAALAEATGFEVRRGLLEDFVADLEGADAERPEFAGELVGARVAPLLPGVWSTRSWIKLANRRAEAALEGWAEPFAALAAALGARDERPALALAWRELLKNQAHDSICGCSRDEVHRQMRARFASARELADETASRALDRLAGAPADRRMPWSLDLDLAVFNPSPHPRSDLVRFRFDPHPWILPLPDPTRALHPALLRDLSETGFAVDGRPARRVPAEEVGRAKLLPDRRVFDVEFVARDVPAFGWRRVRLTSAADGPADELAEVAPGSPEARIEAGDVAVAAEADGRFRVRLGALELAGLGGVEDVGDRGDTYDFDPVAPVAGGGEALVLRSVRVLRRRHAAGIAELEIQRVYDVPAGLAPDRLERSGSRVPLALTLVLRVARGVPRVDLRVRVENAAHDHRLRLLFPVGAAAACAAATTFDVVTRRPGASSDAGWLHPAPRTFPQQGFVHANGLTLVAPGLAEAELVEAPDGATLAVTLLRSVGHLSRHDLRTRPGPAGPGTETPEAQCMGPLEAQLALFAGLDPAAARDAELGLRAVAAGEAPLVAEGAPLVSLAPSGLLLTALKPAEEGDALVVRVLNPGDAALEAQLALGLDFAAAESVRLDETPDALPLERSGHTLRFPVEPHALRTIRIAR